MTQPPNNPIHDVQQLLDRAAHALLLFTPSHAAAPAPDDLDATADGPVLSDRRILRARGRRMVIDTLAPSVEHGLRGRTRIGEAIADLALRWSPVPDGFAPFPGRPAPEQELDPSRRQRIGVEGRIDLGTGADGSKHGFRTVGSGLAWPREGDPGAVDLAIVGSVLAPHGGLDGRRGVLTLAGRFASERDFRLVLTLRLLDPGQTLVGQRELPPLAGPSAGEIDLGNTSHLLIRTYADPVRTEMITAPAGGQGFAAPEIPTLIETDFALGERGQLLARQQIGAPIGEHNLKIYYFPSPQNPGTPLSPIPFFDEEIFLVDTAGGQRIGSFHGDVVEGRSVQCPIAGAHRDLAPQLFGGIGRIEGGEGCFEGARGWITNVGIGTVSPHLTSILYLLELEDPEGRFRAP